MSLELRLWQLEVQHRNSSLLSLVKIEMDEKYFLRTQLEINGY